MDGDAAEQAFGQLQRVTELFGDGFEDVDSRTGHFGADSVAGQN
jgi:phage gp37-like protein